MQQLPLIVPFDYGMALNENLWLRAGNYLYGHKTPGRTHTKTYTQVETVEHHVQAEITAAVQYFALQSETTRERTHT